MKPLAPIWKTPFLLLVIAAAITPLQAAPVFISPGLQTLARRASSRRGWNALRRYARFARSEEPRGLAWFVLGYREYDARLYGRAAADLSESAASACSLADFAAYYEALARQQLRENDDAIQALQGFSAKYPESALRLRAVNLLATLLIEGGHPEAALQALDAEPETQGRTSSLLLRAKAYEEEQNDFEAAAAYQSIYYRFPTSFEASDAEDALRRLRIRMGSSFPNASDKINIGRARKLFVGGEFRRALSDYDSLLLDEPRSPIRAEWQLGRARCLLLLRRYSEAIETLKRRAHHETPVFDAEGMALEVEVYGRADDEASMLNALGALYKRYPHSPFYGDALFFAGGYFARQGFWQTAAGYYQPLARSFPGIPNAPEAAWRVAWYDILAGNDQQARTALLKFLERYPGSSRVPAALYWLARLGAQSVGPTSQTREIDHLIVRRFPNSFYGWEAQRALAASPAGIQPVTVDAPTLPAILTGSGITLPPPPPVHFTPCGRVDPDPLLGSYVTLTSLNLDRVAESYLEDALLVDPKDREILLALARVRAKEGETASALFAARSAVPDYQDYSFNELPREVWNLLYPRSYWYLVRRYARANRLDPYLVMAVIRQESAFNPRATSSARARGLMQMEPETVTRHIRSRWRRRRIVRELYNPSYNLRVSCRYLSGLFRAFDDRPAEALAAYNAGDFRVREWLGNSKLQDPSYFLETIPFTDTRAYVEAILRDAEIYREILTGRADFMECR